MSSVRVRLRHVTHLILCKHMKKRRPRAPFPSLPDRASAVKQIAATEMMIVAALFELDAIQTL